MKYTENQDGKIRQEVLLTRESLLKLIKRYHFEDSDLFLIESIYNTLLPLLVPDIYIKTVDEESTLYHEMVKSRDGQSCDFAVIIVTLGAVLDIFRAAYLDQEHLREAYMIDCLSNELMFIIYEKIEDIIKEQTGLWVQKYEFLGGKYALEMIPMIFDYIGQNNVTFNHAYALQPSKSVVMLVELSTERGLAKLNICTDCNNINCVNRDFDCKKNQI